MTTLSEFAASLAAALDHARLRAAAVIVAEVPADVAVSTSDEGIALTGRSLSLRALTDPRLRDFAGLIR